MDRTARINELMKREISQIIQQELGDPRFQFVSITHVDVSRDLQHARVEFSVLGGQDQVKAAKRGLDNARGLIRRIVAGRVAFRYIPEIEFFYDQSIEQGIKLEKTLQEIRSTPVESGEKNNESYPAEDH
jgi:ribosome-binding factor A